MFDAYKSITRGRAALERDRVVFGAMFEDEEMESVLDTLDGNINEDTDDAEINELLDKIPESDDQEEVDQIDRILNSDEDLDVDEVLAVDPEAPLDSILQ